MKRISLLIALLYMILPVARAQDDFEVPQDYVLVAKEDYAKYEKDIIAAAKWLEATPLNKQAPKRREVSAFVAKWVMGSPTVTIDLNSTIFDFNKKNEGFMVLFMAASSRYVLENNYSADKKAMYRFAMRSLIKVYNSGQGISKDKQMEKAVKADEEGKLDEWIASKLKVS
jgi:hypothetical protein